MFLCRDLNCDSHTLRASRVSTQNIVRRISHCSHRCYPVMYFAWSIYMAINTVASISIGLIATDTFVAYLSVNQKRVFNQTIFLVHSYFMLMPASYFMSWITRETSSLRVPGSVINHIWNIFLRKSLDFSDTPIFCVISILPFTPLLLTPPSITLSTISHSFSVFLSP